MPDKERYEVTAIGAVVYGVWAYDHKDAIERWSNGEREVVEVEADDFWGIERVETGH